MAAAKRAHDLDESTISTALKECLRDFPNLKELPFPATAPFFPQAPAHVLFSRSPSVRADPTI